MNLVYRLLTLCVCAGFVMLYVLGPVPVVQENDTSVHQAADKTLSVDDLLVAEPEEEEEEYTEVDIAVAPTKDTAAQLFTNPEGSDEGIYGVYEKLWEGYEERMASGMPLDMLLPEGEGQEREITITTRDETGTPIEGVFVHFWGAVAGVSDAAGEVQVNTTIPASHNIFHITARKSGYSPAFTNFNALHVKSKTIKLTLALHSGTAKIVNTNTEDLRIAESDLSLVVEDDCPVHTVEGDCYEGDMTVEYNFIAADQAEEVSIPLQALVNGEVKRLTSNGMAFTDFFSADGEYLSYGDASGEICYTVPEEQMQTWNERMKWEESQEWYRWFDRSIGYWKYDADAQVSIVDDQFCVTTSRIY